VSWTWSGTSVGCAKNRRQGKIAPLRRDARTQNHGGSFQMGDLCDHHSI